MRVALLIDRWQPDRGGAEAALDLLARHLVAGGHGVHVFGERAAASPPGTFHPVIARGWSRGQRERSLGRAMVAAAHRAGCEVTVGVRHLERVDLLWCHGGSHRVTLEGRWRGTHGGALPAGVGGGAPPIRGRHRVFLDLERAALEGGARLVACPSALVRDELKDLYPSSRERLVVCENGVDLERFHPRERRAARERLRVELGPELGPELGAGLGAESGTGPGGSGDPPLIVFPGRNPRLKGLPALLRALVRVDGPWHLVIAGPRRPGVWLGRARRVGIDPTRLSVRPHLDPVTLAAGADLCALPTWRDPCPLVTLEALAAGTPVVTSRFAGTAPVVGDAGAVVEDPADAHRLGQAIAQTLARRRGGELPPEEVRARVEGRGLGPWMEGMVALLKRLAGERSEADGS